MWLFLLESKAEAAEAMKWVMAAAKVEFERRLRDLRTGNSSEFTSITFVEHCTMNGVTCHFSAPYSLQ